MNATTMEFVRALKAAAKLPDAAKAELVVALGLSAPRPLKVWPEWGKDRWNFSKKKTYQIVNSDDGPDVFYSGRFGFITARAEEEWIERLANPSATLAKKLQAEAETRRSKARMAGTIAAESDAHVSKIIQRHKRPRKRVLKARRC